MDETIRVELETMRAEHRRLDDEIAALSSDGITDQLEIARLKRRKLLLKDQIQRFINEHTPDIIA